MHWVSKCKSFSAFLHFFVVYTNQGYCELHLLGIFYSAFCRPCKKRPAIRQVECLIVLIIIVAALASSLAADAAYLDEAEQL